MAFMMIFVDDIRIRNDEKILKKMLDNIFEFLYNQNCIK